MKVYVWTVPTRLFHALLVLFTLGAYVTAQEDRLLTIHVAFGVALGVLILFRIVWGLVGPRYSRFSDLDFSARSLRTYMLTLFHSKKSYIGHNPAAGFALIAIIGVMLLLVVTGFLTYGIQENRGVFAFLHSSFFKKMELFEALHEMLSVLLWMVIGMHVAGVMLDRLLHAKEGTLHSIVKGHKNIEGESATLTLIQKVIALIGIGSTLYLFIYILSSNTMFTAGYTPVIDYKKEHPLFVNECGSCHTLYPPSLLPQRSWEKIMGNLENHFGDDASLEAPQRVSILNYLKAYAAEYSTSEASLKIGQSMIKQDIIAVTQTAFWKTEHEEIDPSVFEQKAVKSRANCKACHTDIEQGRIEDTNIKLPQGL